MQASATTTLLASPTKVSPAGTKKREISFRGLVIRAIELP
jgi:hypothetical protein